MRYRYQTKTHDPSNSDIISSWVMEKREKRKKGMPYVYKMEMEAAETNCGGMNAEKNRSMSS